MYLKVKIRSFENAVTSKFKRSHFNRDNVVFSRINNYHHDFQNKMGDIMYRNIYYYYYYFAYYQFDK